MGNVTQRQDNNLGLTENIHYDNDYRLSYTQLGGTRNLSMSYDSTGNITSRSDVAGGASWTYDPARKHAVTQAGSSSYVYSYDLNGNMTSRQGSTISWSSSNYPTSISAGSGSTAESISLSYGPDRQRWYQYYTGNGTTESTYHAGPLEIVTSGSVTSYRHYIYAGSEPVAVYSRSSSGNAVDYVLSDHQGSVAALTTSTGSVAVSESFTPYGNRRNPTTWSGAASNSDLTTAAGITRQANTFQTQLGLWMGLSHMNGRVEDSLIGRFMSADPNIPDPTNTQDYNRYTYVDNNPLTLTDPSGFDGMDLNSQALNCPNGHLPSGEAGCAPVAMIDVVACDQKCQEQILSGYAQLLEALAAWQAQMQGRSSASPSWAPTGQTGGAAGANASSNSNSNSNSNSTSSTNSSPQNNLPKIPDPCTTAGGAASPAQFASQGQALAQQMTVAATSMNPFAPPIGAPEAVAFASIASFHRGGSLDAQASGADNIYANYVYGVYFAAAGFSLNSALNGANTYAAAFANYDPNRPMDPTGTYPHIPADNLAAITKGFNDQLNGTLYTKPAP